MRPASVQLINQTIKAVQEQNCFMEGTTFTLQSSSKMKNNKRHHLRIIHQPLELRNATSWPKVLSMLRFHMWANSSRVLLLNRGSGTCTCQRVNMQECLRRNHSTFSYHNDKNKNDDSSSHLSITKEGFLGVTACPRDKTNNSYRAAFLAGETSMARLTPSSLLFLLSASTFIAQSPNKLP